MVEAACLIGSTQVQGRATLAGNLCNASPAADSVPALIAAGAVAVIVGPGRAARGGGGGRRGRPRAAPRWRRDEFVLAFRLPPRPARAADAYLRLTPRTEMDIAVVGCGVNLTLAADGSIADARVALGAVAPTQLLVAEAAAALIGHRLDAATLAALDAAARAACRPIADKRGTIAYRIKVAGVLARRAAVDRLRAARSPADEQAARFRHRQRRARRVPLRAAADPAGRAARRAWPDRHQGRLRLRRLRRLQRHPRRPAGLLLPGAGRRGRGRRASTTIEGLAKGGALHPLQQQFLEHAALQCGFCTPGLLVAAKALLDRNPEPDRNRGALLAGRQPLPLHRLRQGRPRRARRRRGDAEGRAWHDLHGGQGRPAAWSAPGRSARTGWTR